MTTSVITFAPTTASLGQARRWLQDQLEKLPAELCDTAVLLLSELVTNSLLHSASAIEVTVRQEASTLRIEVFDEGDDLPLRKDYSLDATTGRGLQLIELLASNWGSARTTGGKFVWFELGLSPQQTKNKASERIEGVEQNETFVQRVMLGQGADELRRFVIRSLPVALLTTASQQYEGLLREFRFIVESRSSQQGDVPARLLQLIDSINATFSGFSTSQQDQIREAATAGIAELDVEYGLPPQVGEVCRHLDQLLDEADSYCQEGELLLTLAPAPGAVAFRKWFLDEFVRQSSGMEPIPWPASVQARELAIVKNA